MNLNLFRLALDRLEPSDWAAFEKVCSTFLLPEFTNLRTMAHPAGDGGRDSELFSPEGNPFVAAQYSVTSDWKSKIRQTVKRLQTEHPTVRVLVYMSNQLIGGQADDLRKEILAKGIMVDPRDRNWFLERATADAIREGAANELIDRIARPYLSGENVIEKPSSPLTSGEAKAALIYLGLQWQDDIAEKGLTKLSFDALVRAALRHTHSESRMPREKVHEAIISALPSADRSILVQQIDSALSRLTKRFIRHWQKEDEFCLTYEEHLRIVDRLAVNETEEIDFLEEVEKHCFECLCEIRSSDTKDLDDLRLRVPRILQQLLLRRGEAFVTAVLTGNLSRAGFEELGDIILRDLDDDRPQSEIIQHYPKLVATVIQELIAQPTEHTHLYLRRLANSYTLFSFLNHTPDVQSATRKLFSHGTVWVDTTVLLPIFAERLDDDEAKRRLTQVILTCSGAGVEWRVTTGVIQEINAHMNVALSCSQYATGSWNGRIPFLYDKYLNTGRSPTDFRKWLSLFRGSERPEDDIAQFLREVLEIERIDLDDAVSKVDDSLRFAADRLWTTAHEQRRRNAHQMDEMTTRKLIQHDIETYLGVVGLRKSEQVTELGYRHWLLTFDSNAWDIRDRLKEEFHENTPPSPLLSLTFLLNTMTFGPSRAQTSKAAKFTLPLILDIEMSESNTLDIIQIADDVRRENDGLPEYVIRRKVRDAINKARRQRECAEHNSIHERNVPGAQ